MYSKATLFLIVALAAMFAATTVAAGAPKETRTVCQDGQEKQVNANRALPKGATEGPCVDLEALCLQQYNFFGTVFVPPDQCQYSLGNTYWTGEDGNLALTGNPTYISTYNPETGTYGEGTLVSYTLEGCTDLQTGLGRLQDEPERCYAWPPPQTNTL